MRNWLLQFPAFMLGGMLAACKTTAPAPVASQPFVLTYQQQVILPGVASAASLTFTEVNDSRCPDGGQCVWAGEARVTLVLAEGATQAQSVQLGLGAGPRLATTLPDSVSLTLGRQPYWLRLLAVAPYPSTQGPGGPKVVTLRLRPQ